MSKFDGFFKNSMKSTTSVSSGGNIVLIFESDVCWHWSCCWHEP